MFQQGRRPSDSESSASEISEITSRATTLPDSWSNTTLPQELVINSLNIQPIQDDRSSTPFSTTGSVNTVISNKANRQKSTNSPSNQVNRQNQQQQQQPWVNPYWGSNWKPYLPTSQMETNNTNIEHSPINTGVQQLIPGSILINDRGEIDDLSYKQNAHLDLSTSNNSFNPGAEYVSDDSGGPGGYLVPTHIQRRIVTSSPGVNVHSENHVGYQRSSSSSDPNTHNRPEYNRQQTFPQKIDHDIQTWVNPYWPKSNQTNTRSIQNNNTNSNGSQQNSQMKSSEKTPSSADTWENPYWKDKTPQTPSTSKQDNQNWENPYWKNKNPSNQSTNGFSLNESLSYEPKVLPIPSFYARIYPPASPVQTAHTKHETVLSTETSQTTTNDNDDLPYTIDRQGIAHYRPESSSMNSTNKTVNFASQNPVSFQNLSSTASTLQTNTSSAPAFPTSNTYRLSSFDYLSLLNTSSSNILTEEDLNSIQHALHLLKTNPNAVPIIEVPNQFLSSNVSYHTNAPSSFVPLFTSNQQATSSQSPFAALAAHNQQVTSSESPFAALAARNQQQEQAHKQPSSTLFSQNIQVNSPTRAYNSNTQQSTLFSTPSYPSHSNESARHFITRGPIVLI